jgi:predicted phosphodiesterase
MAPLEAVLADVDRSGVDKIVCLGDIVDMGPEPGSIIDLLRERDCLCIVGNHDPLFELSGVPMLDDVVEWTVQQLTRDHRDWLDQLPQSLHVALSDGVDMLCVHGSPNSFDDQILDSTPESVLDTWFGSHTFDVLACGHTHVQLLRRIGTRTIINAGSVGMPFERAFLGQPPRLMPWAEYAIVEWQDGLRVDLRRVAFDFEAFRRTVHESSMPGAERWMQQWNG